MLPKLDTFVLLTNEGPSLEKDEHWSKNKHGDDGMRKGNKNGATSDDFRTLTNIAFNMGRVFAGGITKDKARGCLQIAISLDPDFAQAKELLAKLKAEEAGQAPETEE